jgi:hypothetical protein
MKKIIKSDWCIRLHSNGRTCKFYKNSECLNPDKCPWKVRNEYLVRDGENLKYSEFGLKEMDKAVTKFINKIEQAHKDAAHSTLRFK